MHQFFIWVSREARPVFQIAYKHAFVTVDLELLIHDRVFDSEVFVCDVDVTGQYLDKSIDAFFYLSDCFIHVRAPCY
ncbi:hypothetical protein D9M71_536470 [compost metagenome]